ncbi:MAG: VOC family protein [Alphaproteobacteria bacterium]|nr:VOC family protein [Alphaproteobacteria bacterium]
MPRRPIIVVDRIDHVVLLVADLRRAARFYTEILGLRVERWREEIGLVQIRAGQSLIDLQLATGRRPKRTRSRPGQPARSAMIRAPVNVHHIALTVKRLDGPRLKRHFAKLGIAASEPRKQYGADGMGWAMDVIDPDGNIVELKGPPDAAESRAAWQLRRDARTSRKSVPL